MTLVTQSQGLDLRYLFEGAPVATDRDVAGPIAGTKKPAQGGPLCAGNSKVSPWCSLLLCKSTESPAIPQALAHLMIQVVAL